MLKSRRPIWPSPRPHPPSPVLTTRDSCAKLPIVPSCLLFPSFSPNAASPNRLKSNIHHDTSSQHVKDFLYVPAVGRLQEMDVGFPRCLFKEPDTSTAAARRPVGQQRGPSGSYLSTRSRHFISPVLGGPAIPRPPSPLHRLIATALCESWARQ